METIKLIPIIQESGKYICKIIEEDPKGPCTKMIGYVRGPFYLGQGINKAYEYDTHDEAYKAGVEFIKPKTPTK